MTEADLGRPTPCRGWLLRDLLAHMDDSLEAMAVAAQATSLEPGAVGAAGRGRRPARQHLQPGPGPAGPLAPGCAGGGVELGDLSLSRELLGAVGALEITLHGWDVAEAIGRPRSIPPGLAMDLWPVARDHITDADRPFRFGRAGRGVGLGDPRRRGCWPTPVARRRLVSRLPALDARTGRSLRPHPRGWGHVLGVPVAQR